MALSYLAHARNHHFQFQLGSVVDINRENKTITLMSCVMRKASCWFLSASWPMTRW
jgi:NADH dehydrogenase FAD-containing subunit